MSTCQSPMFSKHLMLHFTCFTFTWSIVQKTNYASSHGLNSHYYFHYISFHCALFFTKLQWSSFPKCNQYSFIRWLQILRAVMRQSIPVRQRSGLTLVFGGSAASKHFWAQWSNSLLASVTISWPSLKCKKETQLNLLLFNVLYALCQILYSNLRCCIITHTVLSSSWVKRVFNLSQFLCHW